MYLKLYLPFILVVQFYFTIVCTQNLGHRAKYGEHCNKTLRCDTSSFLTCRDSVCDCQKPETMFYDPDIKSCLVLVGEKCKYQLIKGKDEFGDTHHDRGLVLEEVIHCVQNSWCNRSGVCMCAGDYVELGNGTCISKRNLGETCSSDRECRQDQFLLCFNGRCGCNETIATYNILIRQCVGKAGKPCILGNCVYNAECLDKSAFSLGFTKRRMRQSVQICGCNPGFVADDSGFCRVGLGGQCSNSKPCSDGLKCKDSQCVCQFDNVQLALPRSQTCLSLVGGPCNETIVENASLLHTNMVSLNASENRKFKCIDNARCVLTNNTVYECQCNDGFVANNDGTCDLAFGSICNDSPLFMDSDGSDEAGASASWNLGLSCDKTTPLFCINGVCQCESSLYEYSMEQASCLGKFGARCEVGMTEPISSNLTRKAGCISGAECVPSRTVRSPYGICTCLEGFTVTSNRTCLKS